MGVLPQLRESRDEKLAAARRFFFERGELPETGLAPQSHRRRLIFTKEEPP